MSALSTPPKCQPERVTAYPSANEQLLYFTSSSLRADDSALVFLSDRTGNPNLFVRFFSDGSERQLTFNHDGILKSYVYFDGQRGRGIGKASVSLHAPSGTLFYIQGREIRKADLDGEEVVFAVLPEDQVTAFTHVSASGRRLCVPTTDARALDGELNDVGRPAYDVDARIQAENLHSYLRVFDTESGELLFCEPVPKAWVTHVQFSPVREDWILYNHEWSADCGIRRLWLFDGSQHHRLRPETKSCSKADWVCHEMWERDGSAVIYHGAYADRRPFLGRVAPDGSSRSEIPIPGGSTRYGHFTVGNPGALVSDGYYETDGDLQNWGGDWISKLDVDWEKGAIHWTPLCRNRSSWTSQDAHPHPIFDHLGQSIYFTSDRDGKRAVYRVSNLCP